MLKQLLSRLRQTATEPDPDRLIALAAATLLLEVAWADHRISDAELDAIRRQLASEFRLSATEIEALIEESRQAHDESVGLHRFTRTINEAWDEPRKFSLVESLWRLALSDEQIHRYEEHTIRKIAELLYLSHERFIEAKLRAKRGD
jgi:uncharacterized tellurite resistance protein B-like protein